jgi:hypothetical protein
MPWSPEDLKRQPGLEMIRLVDVWQTRREAYGRWKFGCDEGMWSQHECRRPAAYGLVDWYEDKSLCEEHAIRWVQSRLRSLFKLPSFEDEAEAATVEVLRLGLEAYARLHNSPDPASPS